MAFSESTYEKITLFFLSLLIFSFLGIVFPKGSSGGTNSPNDISTKSVLSQIALMPFMTGKLESPDNPIEKPLSQPISELFSGMESVRAGADLVLNRIVYNALENRLNDRIIPFQISSNVYKTVRKDKALDTPRKLAVKLGQETGAGLVVVGTLWQFREKGPDAVESFRPSSVAFAIYLIDVSTGKRIWRGAFEGTQTALTEDILQGAKQIKMGLRWLSAEELAGYGVKRALRKFPE